MSQQGGKKGPPHGPMAKFLEIQYLAGFPVAVFDESCPFFDHRISVFGIEQNSHVPWGLIWMVSIICIMVAWYRWLINMLISLIWWDYNVMIQTPFIQLINSPRRSSRRLRRLRISLSPCEGPKGAGSNQNGTIQWDFNQEKWRVDGDLSNKMAIECDFS